MRLLRTAPTVVAALATAGCATLQINGTTQRIPVTSAPPSAEVFLNGQAVGVTPVEIAASRRAAEHHVRVEGLGERTLRRSISWWLLVDIGVGALISTFAIAHRQADGAEPHLGHTLGVAAGAGPVLLDLLTGAAFRFQGRVDFSLSEKSGTQRLVTPNEPRSRSLPAAHAAASAREGSAADSVRSHLGYALLKLLYPAAAQLQGTQLNRGVEPDQSLRRAGVLVLRDRDVRHVHGPEAAHGLVERAP